MCSAESALLKLAQYPEPRVDAKTMDLATFQKSIRRFADKASRVDERADKDAVYCSVLLFSMYKFIYNR